jgi:hypothetical protein
LLGRISRLGLAICPPSHLYLTVRAESSGYYSCFFFIGNKSRDWAASLYHEQLFVPAAGGHRCPYSCSGTNRTASHAEQGRVRHLLLARALGHPLRKRTRQMLRIPQESMFSRLYFYSGPRPAKISKIQEKVSKRSQGKLANRGIKAHLRHLWAAPRCSFAQGFRCGELQTQRWPHAHRRDSKKFN